MTSETTSTSFQTATCDRPAMPQTIDLYGRAVDGSPMLWQRAAQVEPVTAFERNGRWIRSGHYVIDYNGNATVVHCGNVRDESVSVQFMHEDYIFPRGMIESMLLGRVVVSAEQQAAVFGGRRLSDFFN
jgi:hypothetical protein